MSTDTAHLKALLVSAWAKVDELERDNARAERDVAEALRQKGEALAKVDEMARLHAEDTAQLIRVRDFARTGLELGTDEAQSQQAREGLMLGTLRKLAAGEVP